MVSKSWANAITLLVLVIAKIIQKVNTVKGVSSTIMGIRGMGNSVIISVKPEVFWMNLMGRGSVRCKRTRLRGGVRPQGNVYGL